MDRQDILFDHHRGARIGLPEAVFCEGKSGEALLALLDEHCRDTQRPILFTRLAPEVFATMMPDFTKDACPRCGGEHVPLHEE